MTRYEPNCPVSCCADPIIIARVLAADVSRLLTTPANVPALSARGSFPHRRETLRVDYVTHREAARMLLPEPLALPALSRASIYVTQYFDMFADAPVIEMAQSIEAVSPDGRTGDFVQVVYTDSIPAIIANREGYLQPILAGTVSITHKNAVTDFALRVNDIEVARGSAGYKTEPVELDSALALFRRPKFYLKILGRPMLGERARPVLFGLEPGGISVLEAYRAPARLALFSHVMAPLDDLPIIHVESCHTTVLQWTPGSVEVLHRYT